MRMGSGVRRMVRVRAQRSEDVRRVEEKEKRGIGMWDVRDSGLSVQYREGQQETSTWIPHGVIATIYY